jgi:hypothetical protein
MKMEREDFFFFDLVSSVTDGLSIERKVNLLALGKKPVRLLMTTGGKFVGLWMLRSQFQFVFLFHPHSSVAAPLSHNLPSEAGLLGGNIFT